jgi:putative chitinase
MITLQQFQAMVPACRDPISWQPLISDALEGWSEEQTAAFIAQCAHESSHFNILSENLNYSAKALLTTFKKYFNEETAVDYERQPARIANRVYANRMGNAGEFSGDGYKYRGRGILQVTGKNNYQACSQHLFQDDRLLQTPDLLTEKKYALESALWYWDANNLLEVDDFVLLTKKINGGTHGLAERTTLYNRALTIV